MVARMAEVQLEEVQLAQAINYLKGMTKSEK
jgi:hypothetical protein